jgi:predicted aldo/keto reductase-like oxidoreductase
MNDEKHIDENIRAASEAQPHSLSPAELALVEEARGVYNQKMKVGCTGCAYCMPCPSGVNIPACFKFYNDMSLFENKSFKMKYMTTLIGMDGRGPSFASKCIQCGKCEKHCPQNIPIRERLKEVSGAMEGFYVKPAAAMAKWYFNRKKKKR